MVLKGIDFLSFFDFSDRPDTLLCSTDVWPTPNFVLGYIQPYPSSHVITHIHLFAEVPINYVVLKHLSMKTFLDSHFILLL